MSFKPNQPLVFISAERAELTPELNAARTQQLAELLKMQGFEFQAVEGAWTENETTSYEQSFMVYTEARIPALMAMARQFEQAAILVISPNATGILISRSGSITNVEGRFHRLMGNEGPSSYTVIDGERWGF